MENLAQALVELMEAQQAESKGRQDCEGGSWGYYGYPLIAERQRCEKRVADLLERAIDDRVRAIVGHLLNNPNA